MVLHPASLMNRSLCGCSAGRAADVARTLARGGSGADGQQNGPMGSPGRRESTPEMVSNIEREVRELRSVLARCQGDRIAEPKVTAALLAHLLFSSREVLQNLLIETAQRPVRLLPQSREEKTNLG